MPYWLHIFRFTLAWAFNLALYIVAAIYALVSGILYGAPEFREMLIAWLAGLIFTWAVIEPGEVIGIVVFPRLFNSRAIAKCREKCKDAGIYG